MAKTIITGEFWLSRKLRDISQTAIGREPGLVTTAGMDFMLEYDPPLSTAEKTQLREAMPEWIRKMYNFQTEDG